MTLAVSKALEAGAAAVLCASTGNTAASAAAYAARAGLRGARADATGRRRRREARADAHARRDGARGARRLRRGPRRRAGARHAVARTCSSTRSIRTAARGRRPPCSRSSRSWVARRTRSCCPYGGGGNTSSYAQALAELGLETPIVSVEAADRRATLASAIRIGDPCTPRPSPSRRRARPRGRRRRARRRLAQARSGGGAVLRAVLGRGPRRRACAATSPATRIVVTITGHGLKDPDAADRLAPPLVSVEPDPTRSRAAGALQ